jgi:hypothetical protein
MLPVIRISPSSDRPIRHSSPPRGSTSRINTNLLERDRATPEPPSVEPLTPCTNDGYLPYTDDSGRMKSAIQSLLGLLRLPLILDSILRITDEGEQLNQGLRSALGQRSVPEQHQIRSFARSLCHNCDNLYMTDPSLVNKESDVRDRQTHEELSSDLRVQDDVALKPASEHSSAVEPQPPIEPANTIENEDGDIALEGRDEVPGGDTRRCADNGDVKQSTFQRTDRQHPQPIHIRNVKERSGPTPDASCTATSRQMTGDSDNLNPSKGAMASCTSASVAGITLVASSPNTMPTIEPMTPERTLSPVGLRGATPPRQKDDCEPGCLDLLGQAIDDFVIDSHEQVQQFSLPGNSRETYKAVFDSLRNKANEAGEGGTRWSDGSEWVSLLEAGHGERHKGAIYCALTAIAFTRWHVSQVALVDSATTTQKAAQEVSARILGPKPEDDENHKGWEQRRKKLSTHLTRGRKWSRLVEELGCGILLKNAWYDYFSKEMMVD